MTEYKQDTIYSHCEAFFGRIECHLSFDWDIYEVGQKLEPDNETLKQKQELNIALTLRALT